MHHRKHKGRPAIEFLLGEIEENNDESRYGQSEARGGPEGVLCLQGSEVLRLLQRQEHHRHRGNGSYSTAVEPLRVRVSVGTMFVLSKPAAAYPHRIWVLWWQGGKRHLRLSWCPCRGRLGTLKTPSCPWRWVPSSRSKFGNWTSVPSLYNWNIAECDVKPQSTKPMC